KDHLDNVVPDRPAALWSKDGHSLWVNSAALAKASITAETTVPEGGVIEIDPGTGNLTGILKENAIALVIEHTPEHDDDLSPDLFRQAMAQANCFGITQIHDMDGLSWIETYRELCRQGEATLRAVLMIPEPFPENLPPRQEIASAGPGWIFPGHIKILADGALGSSTAWMWEPYENASSNSGMPLMPESRLEEMIKWGKGQGYPAAVHAIGDRAVTSCARIMSSLNHHPRSGLPPHRIEHAQCIRAEDMKLVAEAGIFLSMQPVHYLSDREIILSKWGSRQGKAFPFRSLLYKGACLAFGSDCPIENWDPFRGIYAAVARPGKDGADTGIDDVLLPQERISPRDALYAFTRGAAHAGGIGDRLGKIAPGMIADLAVLDRDLLTVKPEEIPDTKVTLTIVNGKVVYGR
ncbi:amidohydrolase, partial [Acidobacteriota bacterium]